MLIRVNKTTNEIDNSLIIPQLAGFENIELLAGWEWTELNSEWFINYETEKIAFENELNAIEYELKAETLELEQTELIKYLMDTVIKQNEIIDNLIIEVL
jgi:hypothetical protein